MNDRQDDKLDMYFSVIATAGKHPDAVQALPAFATAYAGFQTEVDAIRDAAEEQETGITGSTRAKNRGRQAVADTAYPVSTALEAWADIEGEPAVAARVRHPYSGYLVGRAAAVETKARTIHTEATARLAQLADYGITQAMLDTLAAAIDDYHALLTAPRTAITDRKAATAALVQHFAAADKLLKNRMDKLVPVLAGDHPRFATDYRNARIIVDSGASGRKDDEEGESDDSALSE